MSIIVWDLPNLCEYAYCGPEIVFADTIHGRLEKLAHYLTHMRCKHCGQRQEIKPAQLGGPPTPPEPCPARE